MAPSPAAHSSMHAGLQAAYYPYKMLLSTLRSVLTPRVAFAPDHERRALDAPPIRKTGGR
jgi:hypothetical protein